MAHPPWFRKTSWLEAEVDLSDFGLGVVFLKDASAWTKASWQRAASKDLLAPETTALMLAAYVDRGDEGIPPRGSSGDKWKKWMESQRSKPVERLTQGILYFMDEQQKDGEEAPN